MQSSLYSCTVFHKRVSPRDYGFTTRVFMWHLDLDEIDTVIRKNPLVSHNRFNIYSFRDADHIYLGQPTLRENVEAYLEQEGVDEKPARITLLTNLRTFGHVFNPVSFYFCYDEQDQPLAVVVEVHNTFGELKPFLLTREDLKDRKFSRKYPKLFYISPFSELDQVLEIKAEMPGGRLALYVNNYEKGEPKPFFRSSLTGARVPLTTGSLLRYSLRFPLITLKVILLIHWHALKLYLKKVPFHAKDENPHLQTGILPKKHQSTSS
ncbi:MAG: DUF1365 domain-containing protein [Puniceicoccaceae bacterium]